MALIEKFFHRDPVITRNIPAYRSVSLKLNLRSSSIAEIPIRFINKGPYPILEMFLNKRIKCSKNEKMKNGYRNCLYGDINKPKPPNILI